MGEASVFGPANKPVVSGDAHRANTRIFRPSKEIVFTQSARINAGSSGEASQWWPHGDIRIFQVLLVSKGPVSADGAISVELEDQALATLFSNAWTVTGNTIIKSAVDISVPEGGLRAVTNWASGGDIDGLTVICRYIASTT